MRNSASASVQPPLAGRRRGVEPHAAGALVPDDEMRDLAEGAPVVAAREEIRIIGEILHRVVARHAAEPADRRVARAVWMDVLGRRRPHDDPVLDAVLAVAAQHHIETVDGGPVQAAIAAVSEPHPLGLARRHEERPGRAIDGGSARRDARALDPLPEVVVLLVPDPELGEPRDAGRILGLGQEDPVIAQPPASRWARRNRR